MKFLSAHQPNLLPWAGFFLKIKQSDIFVFSDDVKYVKQQNVNRAPFQGSANDFNLILPVEKSEGTRVFEKKISRADLRIFRTGCNKVLEHYKNAPFFVELSAFIHKLNDELEDYEDLSEFNIFQIQKICRMLEIDLNFELASNLGLEHFSSNNRLLQRAIILKTYGYICGHGSSSYQDDKWLIENGMKIQYVDYNSLDFFGSDKHYSICHLLAMYGSDTLKRVFDI